MTQLMQPSALSPEQLLKRSKELDARETYLAAREQLAGDVETAITKGQRDLSLLDTTILARETILDNQNIQLQNQEAEYTSKTKILAGLLAKEQVRYESWQAKVEIARQDLKTVRDAIEERTDYLKQQEAIVQEQATEGNSHLRGLDYEVTELKQVIRDLEVKKKSLKATIIDLETDLAGARESFLPELTEHEGKVAIILATIESTAADSKLADSKLREVTKQVNAALIKRQQIVDNVDEKLLILDTKEREIMAKREALRQEREEMEEAKHYFTTPKSLYDV